ncbi:MurR/RpiR family transcriptional regulator [Sulfobacillus thermosulfidooxidans]|uniref:MurR/RpiR family transcriptional regulator n=1 Tax=Sulfobacillus thermosulfidooxidans TaxID=28034 RepID=UPI000A6D0F77|nr:MurR/RpiR family transcriptional regulator [Sulfobacillus thermosulfidooxidans]
MVRTKPITLETFHAQVAAAAQTSSINQQIAEYVSEHYREASFMTASELAHAIGVSQASITRFSVAMGFSGFTDFVRTLQGLVREEWHTPERAVYVHSEWAGQKDLLVEQEIQNLEGLPDLMADSHVEAMAKAIASAKRVILAGARASSTIIPYAAYFLSKVKDGVEMATPNTPVWETFGLDPDPDSLVVAWVFPRYPLSLVTWLERLRRQNIQVAAFTDRWVSPAVHLADPVVVVPVASASLFDSYAAPFVLINYIIRQVAALTPGLQQRLEALEARDQANHAFWNRPNSK